MGRRDASLTNEEKLDRIKERKNKRARRTARARWLKNLIWWLFGTISGIVIIGATVAVAVCVIPVDTYLNLAGVQKEEDDKIVSDKLANSSLLNIGLNIGAFTVSDLPIVVDALSNVFPEYKEYEKPSDFDPTSSDAPIDDLYILDGEEYLNAFNEVGEYINSANSTSSLYLKNNESFNKLIFEELNLDEMPFSEFKGEGLDKLKAVQITRVIKALGFGNILEEKADDGEIKPSALANVLGEKTVMQIKEIEPAKIIGCLKLSVVLPVAENQVLYDVLLDIVNFEKAEQDKISANDITIGNLTENEFSLNGLKLSTVLGERTDVNATIYDILTDATGKGETTLTISDLNGLNLDGIKLSKFLVVAENTTLYSILSDATGISNKENITVGDLKSIDINNVKLSTILKVEDNAKLYDILVDAVNGKTDPAGTKTAQDIIVGDLQGINVENIKLSTVLELPTAQNGLKNALIYEILADATGKPTGAIMVKDLSTFDTSSIKLTSVLKQSEGNKKLYDILKDVSGKTDATEITVSDLTNFSVDNIKLSTVLTKNSSNEKLFSILVDVSGKAEDKITLADLSNFNVDNIKLSTVLTKNSSNEKLFSILTDVSGKAEDKITLADLTTFNPNDIKLKSVLPADSNNLILKKLLEDETATLGTLSAKIDDLDFCEIYGHDCFEKYVLDSGKAKYVKVLDKDGVHYDYVLSTVYEINPALYTGTEFVEGSTTEIQYYQVSNIAGIWLFMMYHEVDVDGDNNFTDGKGNAKYYEYYELKVSGVAEEIDISESVRLATVRQFIDAGIVKVKPTAPITNETLLNMTIEQAILKLNTVMPSA